MAEKKVIKIKPINKKSDHVIHGTAHKIPSGKFFFLRQTRLPIAPKALPIKET